MSLNPLNELKRRLEDEEIPLPKRLCLAKNVIQSHHFPSAPKQRVVADWLKTSTQENKLSGDDLKNVIGWLNVIDDFTNDLKSKLIQIVSKYLKGNQLQNDDIQHILSFLENDKLSTQLSLQIEDSLSIAITLLQHLKCDETTKNIQMSQKIFNNIIKFYKESKKKLEFIEKFLDGENLETVFDYLDSDRSTVINVCENILFPKNKKSFFASYLQTLVRKDNMDDLISEKGDNIQSVLKIMDAFFTFPNRRTCVEPKFLSDFIDVFVSCYRAESQLIFAFYVMITNCLCMEQNYLIPAMTMNPISFNEYNETVKRNLFLKMLEIILYNEVDINVRLSDTLGVNIPKNETKKTFLVFLESLMRGQLKMEGKPDKTTFNILKTALKLDPSIVEPKIEEILPPLMCTKKSANVIESYTEMLNFMLETFFKLGRGTLFFSKILPLLKACLGNTEQNSKRKSRQSVNEQCEKIKIKVITANNVLPEESVELYGKLTSELMFRQNKELLASLKKDFEDLSLNYLDEENLCSSTITVTEVISSILCSFFKYCKMADHTVPLNIAEEFWMIFNNFESISLKKFGKHLVERKLDCSQQLILSFLKLCLNFSYLKLFHIKYSNVKLEIPFKESTSDVFDMSVLLPFLTTQEWSELASTVNDDKAVLILDELLLIKTMAIQVLTINNPQHNEESVSHTKSYLIKQISTVPQLLEPNRYMSKVLLTDLNQNQLKQVAKVIIKQYLTNADTEILKNEAISNNKPLLTAFLLETVKNILKCFNNSENLTKSVSKSDFDFIAFSKETSMEDLFGQLTINEENCENNLSSYVEILKQLQIYYLSESYQLIAIFVLLVIKNNSEKKMRRSVDHIMLSIFELSSQPPDLYKIFPVKFIFSFKDKLLIDLLSLKIKTANGFLVIKGLLESAVRRVKNDKELVISIVELILSKQSKTNSTSMEFFADPAFQISCIILPLIVKQKKVITLSAYRSILADLQEKLHKSLLESFKNIDFKGNSNIHLNTSSNIDDSMVVSDSTMATLNAISAYSLTLSKYCESNDAEEFRNLDYLWAALEYFVQSAIETIQNPESKYQHVESSIQLLNSVLRYIKKLEYHEIFQTKDKLFVQIWNSLKARLSVVLEENAKKKYVNTSILLEDISVTIKFLSEWVSVEGFASNFIEDINNLSSLEVSNKNEAQLRLTSLKVAKYLLTQILKANLIGPKCVALSKLLYQSSRNLKNYIHEHYENEQLGVIVKSKKKKLSVEFQTDERDEIEMKTVKIDDTICDMVKICLGMLSESILAAKKINLDYKSLDSIFEVQHVVHFILGRNTIRLRCEIAWQAFFKLFEGSVTVLNSLLVSREELLEDRWPCYMQCYRALVTCLCGRSSTQEQLERGIEEKLGEMAHSIEKLTQSICKRKSHVSRIAAYSVGDICATLERYVPPRNVKQHLENSIALLIQASDTTHAMAFLRRALAGSAGQMTMTNMYNTYKRYHKYVGNA